MGIMLKILSIKMELEQSFRLFMSPSNEEQQQNFNLETHNKK